MLLAINIDFIGLKSIFDYACAKPQLTVKTPVKGNGCISELFELLCADLVSKQVSDLSDFGVMFGMRWLSLSSQASMCLLVIFYTELIAVLSSLNLRHSSTFL